MKKLLLIGTWVLVGLNLAAQTISGSTEGSVSFVSSQNVYVKFASTKGIDPGDTLFIQQNNKPVAALVVKELSSTSCVCLPLIATKFNVSDRIYSIPKSKQKEAASQTETIVSPPPVAPTVPEVSSDTAKKIRVISNSTTQSIHGYIALGSFTNFSNTIAPTTQRLQYTLSLNARNLGNSGLSVESYIIFQERLDSAWKAEFKESLFNGLKIYNLSVNYDFNKSYSLLFGRRINPKLSNMGAVDGLQFEARFKPITVGVLAGSRPDTADYGFNFNLLQYGIYLYNELPSKNGGMQSTLAFVQQDNHGKTDRRFIYLQHSNSLVKNLNFFGTVEFDLYNMKFVPSDTINPNQDTIQKSSGPRMTNLYLSLRYRVNRQLSLSVSYSNRQNIVYYETYKNYLDKLLEFETTQGYLFNVNYRPVNRLFVGATVGYRFQQQDPKPSANVNAYITYSDIPSLHLSATGTVVLLQTSYLTGGVYGIGINRDFAKGKLYASLGYKYVNYKFSYSDEKLPQNIGELSLTWRIYRKISLSGYYEGTFEKVNTLNRLYIQLNAGL